MINKLKAKFFLYVALPGGRVPERKERRFVFYHEHILLYFDF